MASLLWKKNSDDTSSKIGADEIGNLFIQTLNSYVRGLSLKIDSFWQKKSCAKIPRKFSTHHAFEWTGQPARVDIFFSSNHNIHKSSHGLHVWASDL